MKKSINIQGMSSTSAYNDGECVQLVNLRKKNGVMKPVSPRKVTKTLAQAYTYLFTHNLPQTGENLIGVRNNNIYHVKADNTETLLTTTTGFKSITQIGNLLNVVDSSGIKILFWVDTEYKVIETNFGGAQTADTLLPVKVDLKVSRKGTATERDVAMYYSEGYHHGAYNDDQNSEQAKTQLEVCKGLFTKALKLESEKGNLHGFVLACTAIELFDGSYILHSNPVLLGQSLDAFTRYEDGFNYINNKAGFVDTALVDESATVTTGIGQSLSTPEGFTNNVTDKCYSGKSNKQYRGTATQPGGGTPLDASQHEAPNLYAQLVQPINTGSSYIYATITGNELQFKVNSNIPEILKPLIKSVSVFISTEVSMYKTDTAKYNGTLAFSTYGSIVYASYNWQPEIKTNADILKELADNQQFYKVHEIPFDDIKTTTENGGWVTIDLKDKLGENLTMQEELTVDNFTHHNLIPAKQIAYNSKLHVMDYKQELFHGWPFAYMTPDTGIGQFAASTQSDPTATTHQLWMVVDIKNQNGISKVIRKTIQTTPYLRKVGASMLSYPDSRATKITIYDIYTFVNSGTTYRNATKSEFKLQASDKQNFAYWINPNLKPENFATQLISTVVDPTEENRIQIYRNSMKVSSVNNPFYFPATQTYTIGTGYIRAAGTNAMRMSEGQFGQYDLYILTSEGAYSFDTGTELAYNRQSPSSLILPISDVVCSTPYGLVFVGERGAYLLNGQEAKLITPQLEQNAEPTSLFAGTLSFTNYIKNLKDILFDNTKDELIFVGAADYNYVLNIESGQFYLSTEKVDMEVKNSMPMLVAEGMNLKDYSQAQSPTTHVSIITRPIYFGMDEVKQLHRAILRGRFYKLNTLTNSDVLFLSLYGSNDGINHTLLRGWRMAADKQDRDYKDFDSGLFARATFRNYALKLEADIDESSEIQYIDFEVADNYNNDKLR